MTIVNRITHRAVVVDDDNRCKREQTLPSGHTMSSRWLRPTELLAKRKPLISKNLTTRPRKSHSHSERTAMQTHVLHQFDQNLPLPHRSDAGHFGFHRGTLAVQESSELENHGSN